MNEKKIKTNSLSYKYGTSLIRREPAFAIQAAKCVSHLLNVEKSPFEWKEPENRRKE